jgi:CheY-like chemotaxis protein
MQNEIAAVSQEALLAGVEADGPRPKILLVEDEPLVRALLSEVLSRQGYQVVACGTPGEALEASRDHGSELALLLTDVVMPQMNGREMALLIQEALPALRVIFMSGYAEQALMEEGQLGGNFEYLQKPFTVGTLLRKLDEAPGQSQIQ